MGHQSPEMVISRDEKFEELENTALMLLGVLDDVNDENSAEMQSTSLASTSSTADRLELIGQVIFEKLIVSSQLMKNGTGRWKFMTLLHHTNLLKNFRLLHGGEKLSLSFLMRSVNKNRT